MRYIVPTLKYWQNTKADLVEQKLYPLLPLQVFLLRHKMEKIGRKGASKKELIGMIHQAKEIVSQIGKEARKLYDEKCINSDDLLKILLANKNLFDYLNKRYIQDKESEEEVNIMTKTLIDPAVLQKGIEQGTSIGIDKTISIIRDIQRGILDEIGIQKYQIMNEQLNAIK